MPVTSLVLASGSPRRRELLSLLGVSYELKITDLVENLEGSETPQAMVQRLSASKALGSAPGTNGIIIGADTTVALDGQVLGKPLDASDAAMMLRTLRNRTHSVYTGLTVLNTAAKTISTDLAETQVSMRNYRDREIEEYVASGDPLDKAGSYAVQHGIFNPVEGFDGCYTNIVGLPLCHLYRVLHTLNYAVPVHPLQCCPWALKNGCAWASAILALPVSLKPINLLSK
ncbi:MAG: Maf family protein [Anaerolineae bacterium]